MVQKKQNDIIGKKPINRFIIRLLIIYTIQLIIKAFDQSFGGFFEFTLRGIVFSSFIILFWIISWYFIEWTNNILKEKKQLWRSLVIATVGYIVSFFSNFLYRFGDEHIFNNIWYNVSFMNPEFTVSVMLIIMMIYWFNEFLTTNIKAKEEKIKAEKLQKENTLAQYMALKAQIEPHFLFNSLSVLNSIVHKDADLASEFIIKLSKTLRYIIEKNDFKLVSLKDEIFIVQDYFFLLKTRFKDGIILKNNIEKSVLENCFIPPVTIQVLIENAVKHNKQTDDNPLEIIIECENDWIVVKNTLNLRAETQNSTGKGLQNITKRFELISGKSIIVEQTNSHFIVKLPVLKNINHENFNN